MSTYPTLYALVHALLCFALATICICRLNHDVCRRYKRARLRVWLVMAASLLSLGQPFIFGTGATPTETLLVLAVGISMVLNASRWMQSYVQAATADPPGAKPPPPLCNAERSPS